MALENSIFSTLFPAMDARQKSSRPIAMPHDTASVMGVEETQVDPTGMMPQPSVEEITAAINAPLMYGTEQLYGGTEDVTETTPTFTDTSSIQGTVTDPNAYKPLYDAPQNEYESSQEALRKNLYDIQNPQNKDKGVKGFLKEGLENFLFGLSHAKDGMGFWESMALGGTGFGAGAINRGANEKRAALRNTPLLQEAVKQAEGRQRLQMQQEQARLYAENIKHDNDAYDKKIKSDADTAAAALLAKENKSKADAQARLSRAIGLNNTKRGTIKSKITTAQSEIDALTQQLAEHQAELGKLPKDKSSNARRNRLLSAIDSKKSTIAKKTGEIKGNTELLTTIIDPKDGDAIVEETPVKTISQSRLQAIAQGEYGGDMAKAKAAAEASGYTIQP